MRILLAHNSLYFPSHGGGDKSNRLLVEALAAQGQSVRVVARVEEFGEPSHARLAADLQERNIAFVESSEIIHFERHGVDVRTLTRSPHLRNYFAGQISEWDPDVILTSTDDPAQLLFELARRSERARVVYLVRATIAAPFGPDSSMPNQERTRALRDADGVVGVSEYVAKYARDWGGLDAVHVPISLMEPGATDALGRFGNSYVTMVNPCAVKGISVFLGIAERMPHLRFAAVPTWGTTPDEMEQLQRLANVTLLPAVDDIAHVLRETRVMLVPSVWAEARSRMVMEAMLRGIPVMASAVGGLSEAKLGVPYLLPVHPVTAYRAQLDRNMVPVAEVPPQNVEPWCEVLQRLTTDQEHWTEISVQSRNAALAYLDTLTAEPFQRYLEELLRKPKKQRTAVLSEDKKKLLALRMKQRNKPNWFPRCSADAQPTLFCFAHAGAGSLAFREWAISEWQICPALLPGREDRVGEPAFEDMRALVAALAEAIRPLVRKYSVFFGHSMGAGVAFELARQLRRLGLQMPGGLIVSGARAPQYRLNRGPLPELTDAELGGYVPDAGVPILRADLKLYRNYIYTAEEPLAIPILAYSGRDDPSVTPEQMTEWRAQTSTEFEERVFPGGHFYLRENLAAVLSALNVDLSGLNR